MFKLVSVAALLLAKSAVVLGQDESEKVYTFPLKITHKEDVLEFISDYAASDDGVKTQTHKL